MMPKLGAGQRAAVNVTNTLLFAIFAIYFTTSCDRSTMEHASASQVGQSPVVATQGLIATRVQPAATGEEGQPRRDG